METRGKLDVVESFKKLQKFWQTVLQPQAAAALDTVAEGPVENLKKQWTTALASLRVVERSVVGGDNGPTQEEFGTALANAAALAPAADLQRLAAAAC
eukprot:5756570-Lingulodinium_polyedra.AAC.1